MKLRRSLLALVFGLFSCALAFSQTPTYTSIVVFGDSLSDTGNFGQLVLNADQVLYPGPLFGYTGGRFTDGSDTQPAAQLYHGVWVEQLSTLLNAHPPVVDQLSVNPGSGTDWAYGSATSASGTTNVNLGLPNTINVLNTAQQIANYLATNPSINPKTTLFVVWSGANDLIAATTLTQIVAAATEDVANVQTLIQAGATNIIVPNLPPLGLVPRFNGNPATSVPATAAAAGFNQALAAGLAQLPASYNGNAIHLYQMDTYSLFYSIVATPSVFNLVDVTDSSQVLPTVNPDTYLFWDTLHPTTRGHNLLANLAYNLLSESASSTSAVTLSTGSAYPGQTVTLTAVVSPGAGSQTTPTGYVTFYTGTTALATATLNSQATASATTVAGPLSASPQAITARYSGDTLYTTSTSPAQNLSILATPVPTTTALQSSSAAANLNASVTFTATISSPVGHPSGLTVNFFDSSTNIGSATTNASGVATLSLATLTAGTHSISATTVASATFASSTSGTVSEVVTAPAFTLTAAPTMLNVTHGFGTTTTVTLTPVGGLTGTYTLACGTLPTDMSCTWSSATLTANGSNTAVSSTLTINTAKLSAARIPVRHGSDLSLAFAFVPLFGGLAFLNRKRLRGMRLTAVLLLLASGAVAGMTGCAGGNSNDTPSGTYTVNVTATPASGAAATVALSVVVQ